MKYNKVRGILRAKQGSQIPIFNGGGFVSWFLSQNPYTQGSTTPIQLKDATDFPISTNTVIDSQGQPRIPLVKEPPELKLNWNPELPKTAEQKYKDQLYKKTLNDTLNNKPTGWQKFGKKMGQVGTGLAEGVGNFITDNAEGIMGAGKVISQNSLDIVGDNFGKFSNTMSTIKGVADNFGPMGKAVGAVVGAVDTWANVINAIGGKRLQNFSVDKGTQERVGGAYTGSYTGINKAGDMAGKKVGLFAGAGSKNRFINEQRRIQSKIMGIDQTNQDMLAMAGNDLNYLNYQMQSNGGYDQLYMGMRAKQGGKLQNKIDFIRQRRTINNIINLDTKEIEWEPETIIFKTGGTITQDWDIIFELPVKQFEEGGKIRTLEELIKYAKEQNPRFVQRLSEEPRGIKFIDDEGNEAEGTHYLESRGEYVIPRIQEINGELKFLSPQEAIDRAIESGNYLKMLPEEAIIFAENYKQGWPEFFNKFKEGGKTKEELETPEIEETSQKNLIPEGALHKNKHHMEHTEGLTQKGIPVIDNDGEQQAEIELDEIIFTLEVTKKLEELYKEGTDEAAIEAGKLLVKEILFNTDDRTGLIAKCQEGGKL